MFFKLRFLFILLGALGLVACDPQDGSGVDSRVGLNGLVVDGRITGATVWVDLNNNNDRNGGEPRAYTDGDGYFSYNPETGMNYCALPTSAFEFRYCLRHGSSQDAVVIRARGGRDLVTGERLRGTLALRTTLQEVSGRSANLPLLSPFTTLLAAAETPAERAAVLNAFDLTTADLRVDFSAPSSAEQLALLANANLIQALQHLLANMRGDASTSVQAENRLAVLRALVDLITTTGDQPIDFAAADFESLANVFDADVSLARRMIASDAFSGLAEVYGALSQLDHENDEEITAGLMAAEVLYIMARQAVRTLNGGAATQIDEPLFASLVSEFDPIADREFDLPAIATALINAPDVTAAVAGNTLGVLPVPWQGRYLVIGFDTGDDTEVFVRFIDGKETDTSGPMSTCIRLDDGDVRYLRGNWSKPLNVKSWIELDDFLGPVLARQSLLRKLSADEFSETVEQSILDEEEFKEYTYEAWASAYLNTSGASGSVRARPRNRDDCELLFNDPDFDNKLGQVDPDL